MIRTLKSTLKRAFTLLEILIAIVILVVGITGIVALFPTAIKTGNQTVVDSYASLITQSVVDAINVGIREARYKTTPTDPTNSWEYFIFDHDGVQDDVGANGIVAETYTTVSNRDFCVLLPRGTAGNTTTDNEIVLHFPTPIDKVGTRSNPSLGNLNALNDEKAEDLRATAASDDQIFQIRRTYLLGRETNDDADPNPVRREFLGDEIAIGGGTTTERLIKDPYPQYSFQFSLQRARIDTAPARGVLDASDAFSDSLFEVKVKIFRNFNENLVAAAGNRIPRVNLPIHEFVTLIST